MDAHLRVFKKLEYLGKVETKFENTFIDNLTSTDSSKSLSLNWLSYRLLQPYSLKVTVGVTEQW